MRGVRFRWGAAVLVAWGLRTGAAVAAGEPDSRDTQARARESFATGIAAFDRQDFAAARRAFLETYALRPDEPVVQRNLALAEIYSGHYLSGARRLSRVLHLGQQPDATGRARMVESLRLAETHLERLTVEVDTPGATITVDGETLGRSPLPLAWYVEPGPYQVQITKDGFDTIVDSRVAVAGAMPHLRFKLLPAASVPAAAATGEPAQVPQSSFSPWLVVTGAGLTAAGVVTGIVFRRQAERADASADEQNVRLLQRGLGRCGAEPPPALEAPCRSLSAELGRRDRAVRLEWTGFGLAAVTGVGTLVYWGMALLRDSGAPAEVGSASLGVALADLPSGALGLALTGSL